MSAFRPSPTSGGGAGLSEAQLSALVTDPELAASEAALLAALATRASESNLSAGIASLNASIAAAGGGMRSGQVAEFRADKVPADCTRIEGSDFVPSGGFVAASAGTGTTTFGAAVYVASGAAPGLWRLNLNLLQRYDLATNKTVGPAYTVPFFSASSGTTPGLAVLGAKIYIAGIVSTSNTVSNVHLVFDTETGVTTQLASFPASIGGAGVMTRSIVLDDNRILTCSYNTGGVAQTGTSTIQFFIYNPATNAAPAQVAVTLPITRFINGTMFLMNRLTDGRILLVDMSVPASGNLLSCLLTVSGNAITASAAEDTGLTASQSLLLPTATGALFGATTYRAYTPGAGWSAAAAPWAWGTASVAQACQRVANLGVLLVGINSNALQLSFYFSSAPTPGATFVKAVKA